MEVVDGYSKLKEKPASRGVAIGRLDLPKDKEHEEEEDVSLMICSRVHILRRAISGSINLSRTHLVSVQKARELRTEFQCTKTSLYTEGDVGIGLYH